MAQASPGSNLTLQRSDRRLVGAAIIVLLLLMIAGVALPLVLFEDWTARGQFGDMFGTVGVLVSSAVAIGVVYTLLIQRKELTLQRRAIHLQGRVYELDALERLISAIENRGQPQSDYRSNELERQLSELRQQLESRLTIMINEASALNEDA